MVKRLRQLKLGDNVHKTHKDNIKCIYDGYEFNKHENNEGGKNKLSVINEHYKTQH